MDVMAQTIGIRVGYSNLVNLTLESMKRKNKIDTKLSHEQHLKQ